MGTHSFNLLEYVSGEKVVELCADTGTFLPGRVLDEDANVLIRLENGGKGVLTVSQIATGEENHLKLRVYASNGGIQWDQENPNHMEVFKYGEPRKTLTRGGGYLSDAAAAVTRVPAGHPEGYLEAFAAIYVGLVEAVRRYIDGNPMPPEEYSFPTVRDGLRGMEFVDRAVESAEKGSIWVKMEM